MSCGAPHRSPRALPSRSLGRVHARPASVWHVCCETAILTPDPPPPRFIPYIFIMVDIFKPDTQKWTGQYNESVCLSPTSHLTLSSLACQASYLDFLAWFSRCPVRWDPAGWVRDMDEATVWMFYPPTHCHIHISDRCPPKMMTLGGGDLGSVQDMSMGSS